MISKFLARSERGLKKVGGDRSSHSKFRKGVSSSRIGKGATRPQESVDSIDFRTSVRASNQYSI